MSDQFVGEIRAFGFNFAPTGWAQCNGQLIPIAQNTALFAILGTQYGGDGKTTFALPNLTGSVAMGFGQGPGLSPRVPGETGGEETVTLIIQEMPAHNHPAFGNNSQGNQYAPAGNSWASDAGGGNEYANANTGSSPMAPGAISPAGGGLPHENRQPYLVVNYCIALQGIFPPRA